MIQKEEQTNSIVIELECRIECARKRLQSLWNVKGRTDAEILTVSIELDMLFNEFQRLFHEKQKY